MGDSAWGKLTACPAQFVQGDHSGYMDYSVDVQWICFVCLCRDFMHVKI